MSHEVFKRANRDRWDELAGVHVGTDFYDVPGFLAGGSSLRSVELEQVGSVVGKSLLHLQCHFGLDTLSWARLGATVTGVDFSAEAIDRARRLAEETGIRGRFLCADVYDLPSLLTAKFDIVYSSYGVLSWLEDLPAWGRLVARYLRPGGQFHLVEFHPVVRMFDPESTELQVAMSYFRGDSPAQLVEPATYADSQAQLSHEVSYQWSYPVADVVTALLDAGLQLDAMRELSCLPERWFPHLVAGDDGWWRLPPGHPSVPLLLALSAHRP